MAWNFRKRIKIAPGIHLNFSKKGVSTSIGTRGASVTFGRNGTYLNTGIPGTGLYNRQKIGRKSNMPNNTNISNQSTTETSAGCLILIALALAFIAFFVEDTQTWLIVAGVIFIIACLVGSIGSKGSKSQDRYSQLLPSAKEAAKNLYEHLCRMNSSAKIRSVLADKVTFSNNLNNSNDLSSDTIENRFYSGLDNRIALMAINDVQKCFEHLGHSTNMRAIESLPVAIFFTMVVKPETDLWNDSMRPYSLAEKSYNLAKEHFISDFDKDKFILVEMLRNSAAEQELVNKYVVLLYRFALTIANADNSIDEIEKKWLADILKFNNSQEQCLNNDDENKDTESRNEQDETNALNELDSLIGLSTVKKEVQNIYNLIKVQKIREAKGLKTPDISYHCVFTGNPGTGKTTVARLVAKIYKELGILKKGHLVETDRSGLVAEYVGQTAVKTNKIIDSALDGVLFIDEAYSLIQRGSNDYGMEAIATLLKRMEDERNRLVVILAGYSNEMNQFINTNPGLQSRFNRYINFDDYDTDELTSIFCYHLKKYDYIINDDALAHLKNILNEAVINKDKNFGNARFVRNLFEKTLEKQAQRLAFSSLLTNESLKEIIADDIP